MEDYYLLKKCKYLQANDYYQIEIITWNHMITVVYKEIEASTKIPVFYLIWGCWIQIWNPFFSSPLVFLDMHSVHFCAYTVHKGVYEFRVNSNIVRLMVYFLVIMH